MSHVFISYSKENQEYAHRLTQYLIDRGLDVWIDDRIDYGEDWLNTMYQAVADCAAFIVIMTPESRRSRWVQREVSWADEREKKCFPLLRDGENWPIFVNTQFVDVRDGSLPDSWFVLELIEWPPSRRVKGHHVTPHAKPAHTPQPSERAEPTTEDSDRLDVFAAITDFMRLYRGHHWVEAHALLARIADSDPVPAWFDVDYYVQMTEDAIEQEERRVTAEREYAVLRLMAQHESPERVWAALQAFWQSYEGYDPDGLADSVRPAPLIAAEAQRLLNVMLNPENTPEERAEAGRKVADIGDPRPGVGLRPDGLPDVDWVEIPAGEFIYQDGERLSLPAFYIARYPITYTQFQVFLDAPDGFERDEWWEGLTPECQKLAMEEQLFKHANHPRDSVNWYQAVSFSRWLSAKLGYEITLPTEQQWEKAARGTDGRIFPWGNDYISGHANIGEIYDYAGPHYLRRTSAVGVYPQGASPYGVLDMAGNLWEWCSNEYGNPGNIALGGEAARVVRGGSWHVSIHYARCAFHGGTYPFSNEPNNGFRVVCSAPMP